MLIAPFGNSFGEELRISLVTNTIDFAKFHCGVDEMDDFIHYSLIHSVTNNFCKLYKVTTHEQVVALFALTFDSLYLDTDDKEDLKRFSGISISQSYSETFWNKHHYPALEISYLAVLKEMQGQKLGAFLIDLIAEKATTQTLAGCQFLTVEALAGHQPTYNAVGFYLKQNFTPCEYPNPAKGTLRMFRPLYYSPK